MVVQFRKSSKRCMVLLVETSPLTHVLSLPLKSFVKTPPYRLFSLMLVFVLLPQV